MVCIFGWHHVWDAVQTWGLERFDLTELALDLLRCYPDVALALCWVFVSLYCYVTLQPQREESFSEHTAFLSVGAHYGFLTINSDL